MKLIDVIFQRDEKPMAEDTPDEIEVNKTYQLCIDDKPNERKYRCGGKKDILSPACTLTLHLGGLTHEEVMELDLEIRNMLDRHDFNLR